MKIANNWWSVMGIAMGLPSLILGVFFGLYSLVQEGILTYNQLIIVLVVVVVIMLIAMVRYAMVKKNRQP